MTGFFDSLKGRTCVVRPLYFGGAGRVRRTYTYYTTYANSNVQDDEYKQYAKARAEELKQYATNATATKK